MEKTQLKEIGQRLRQKRTELNLTRKEFAELADISTGFYGQIEKGTTQMSIDTLIKITSSMHFPMEYVLFGTGYSSSDCSPIIEMLNNCTEREIRLAQRLLKLYLLKVD